VVGCPGKVTHGCWSHRGEARSMLQRTWLPLPQVIGLGCLRGPHPNPPPWRTDATGEGILFVRALSSMANRRHRGEAFCLLLSGVDRQEHAPSPMTRLRVRCLRGGPFGSESAHLPLQWGRPCVGGQLKWPRAGTSLTMTHAACYSSARMLPACTQTSPAAHRPCPYDCTV